MRSPWGSQWKIGWRLTLMMALLIALIVGGNGLIIFQFARARLRTNRLTGVSQQLIAVLRLQETLLSFHQKLNELALSRDAPRFASEAQPLRAALIQETRDTRRALSYLPDEFRVDPAFLTALDTIEVTLPSQLRDITTLARTGDWEMVRLRLDNELHRIETTTAALVNSIDRDLDEELPHVVVNMRDVQNQILVIVPVTAISTVIVAAFFGWAIAGRMIELQAEERVNERIRIARDLHDTMLQSFQAVLMRVAAFSFRLSNHPELKQDFSIIVDQAQRAVKEGREAVQGLRSSAALHGRMAEAIRTFGTQLATGSGAPVFRVEVEGDSRVLEPLIGDEVYRIVCEAVRNAIRHAQAGRVEVRVEYGKRDFRVLVRDDGKGIDPEILRAGGRDGHHGLKGMHERAKVAGGRLSVETKPAVQHTEVALTIPASLAYAKSFGVGGSTQVLKEGEVRG